MAGLTHAIEVPGARRLELQGVLCTLVLALVALVVVFPLVLVAVQSFQVAPPGQPVRYGLDGWRAALGEPGLRTALVNTFNVTFVRQLLSLPLAVLLAWLLARTDLPGRHWLEFAFWAAFFLPPFTVTLSWILLLDPEYGLVNTWLAGLVGARPFNIYSFWGIVWVHVITGSLTVKVILLTPAFRNMNASFEEASRVAGAGGLRTALRITVPVMAPAILSVLLLGTMVSLQTFEVEQVLGLPFRFIAGVIAGMPLGVQIIKSGLGQLGGELEEASRIAGASWCTTYRRIVLRLMAPTLLAVGMITFVGAARNIGNFALLTTTANRPLSMLQLDYVAQRKLEEAVVVACVIMLVSLGGALLARLLGLRGGSLG